MINLKLGVATKIGIGFPWRLKESIYKGLEQKYVEIQGWSTQIKINGEAKVFIDLKTIEIHSNLMASLFCSNFLG